MNTEKRPKIFPRKKKSSTKKKDTSYVEYKHYADLKPVSEKVAPKNKKTMKKIKDLGRFKKK